MPLVDLSEKELLEYRGRNEKPDDFDAFWDKGIREMEALGTEAEFRRADFQVQNAECFHLYFQGMGGSIIHGIYIRPTNVTRPAPAVLEFHGYAGSVKAFSEVLGWAAAGFCYAAMDCRGQGGLSQDTASVLGTTLRGHIVRGLEDEPEKLYYRNVFLDTAQLARIIAARTEVNERQVGAMGGSQGGGLAAACAALTPWLARAALRYPFLSDYRRVWEMDLDKDAYAELKDFFRWFDPRHLREQEIFTRLGYIDVHHLASRIRARTRLYTGLMDTLCPPSTQFAVYNHIQAPKDYQLYPDFGHEDLPGQKDDVMQFMQEMMK